MLVSLSGIWDSELLKEWDEEEEGKKYEGELVDGNGKVVAGGENGLENGLPEEEDSEAWWLTAVDGLDLPDLARGI